IRLDRYFPEWHETYSKVSELNQEGKDAEVKHGIENL
ncbi:acyl-CoA thioesterase, partial [Staphylococcus epidermidis]